LASTKELEAFDFTRCAQWSISSDSYNTIEPLETRKFELAQAQLSAKLGEAAERDGWSVYSAYQTKGARTAGKYGACRSTANGNGFECLAGFDFPIAGQKFTLARSRGKLPTLRCIAGCGASGIAAIHDMGYENMEGETNVEQGANVKRFARECLTRSR
jgi:hypothetical protein